MTEIWDETFKVKQAMWGFEPSPSTVLANEIFTTHQIKNVLIPGIGYGRNAQLFRNHGMTVTGIEISKTAIDLAHKYYGTDLKIYHGSVSEMPFDKLRYDGIYCYALIHLLDKLEREKLIHNCYSQLAENGLMIFAVVTKKASIYRKGTYISNDRFELVGGIKMFFYDRKSIADEFEKVGLFEITEVNDVYPFYLIKCKK